MTPETSTPLAARVIGDAASLPDIASPGAKVPAKLADRAGAFARDLTRRRVSWSRITFVAFVILPTLATFLYALLWATPEYQSEFRVSVRMAQKMQGNSALPSLLGLGLSQSQSDSNAVAQYILSHGLIDDMPPEVDLRAAYGKSSIDVFDRLPQDATAEALLRYWRWMTEAYYETSTETVVVRTSAFTPQDAAALASRTLALSELLVNRMSSRAREDSVAVAKRQVEEAEATLNTLREQIRTLRDKESLLDPREEAKSDLSLAAKLREEVARADANLSVMRRSMDDSAPSVVATKNRIAALQMELDHIVAATVGAQDSARPLSSVFGAFEQLESDRLFAEKSYQAALASLQSAELDASRQQLYLATIVKPNLPQEAYYPRPARMTILVFTMALAFWGLATLILASVRDHR